jgi:hypothetical protein
MNDEDLEKVGNAELRITSKPPFTPTKPQQLSPYKQ